MSKIKRENNNSQNQTNSTSKGRTFNEWIDMIFDHVERRNEERYGINKPSTEKA